MAGITEAGFEAKRQADILDELKDALHAEIGPGLNLEADGPMGQALAVLSDRLAEVWTLGQALYEAIDPDSAEGSWLEALCAIINVFRQAASYSTGYITCTGTATTVIPAGSIVRVPNGERFVTTAAATISGATVVAVRAEDTGPVVVEDPDPGTTSLQIVTPVTGWSSAYVATGQSISGGQDVETDNELRARRQLSLGAVGKGTDPAIRAAALAVTNVEAALCVSNRTDATVDGQPAHSFQVIVWPNSGITEADLVEAIYNAMPAGVQAYGTTTYTVTDSEGYEQEVGFTYATDIDIDVAVTLTVDDDYPVDGDTQVETAITTYLATLSVGDDVLYHKVYSAVANACAGIVSVDTLTVELGTSNISIDLDEIAQAGAFSVSS